MGLNVLSLFDGISGAQVALQKLGIRVDNYFASEIDKYAIKVTQKNFPNTIQVGSVTDLKASDFPKIDLLAGGSPCQGFSMAGKQLNFEDPRSKLFFEYIRLLDDLEPKYFLLENVKMKKEYKDVITSYMGVEPIFINSALLSAQSRQRFYWTNLEVEQPEDKGILLKDVLENESDTVGRVVGRRLDPKTGKRADDNKDIPTIQRLEPRTDGKSGILTTVQKDNVVIDSTYKNREPRIYKDKSPTLRAGRAGLLVAPVPIESAREGVIKRDGTLRLKDEKAQCLDANYSKGIDNRGQRTFIREQKSEGESIIVHNIYGGFKENKARVFETKSPTIRTAAGGGHTPSVFKGTKEEALSKTLPELRECIRKLTPLECERLQTFPDFYTEGVSNTQRYRALGNSFTCDVIAHILKGIKEDL